MAGEIYLDKRGTNGPESSLGTAAVLTSGIEEFGGIIKELIRASMSNPMIGLVVSIISLSVLGKAGVVSDGDKKVGMILIGAAAGIQLTAEIIDDLSKFVPSVQSGGTPSLVTPSGNVLVFGSDQNAQLNALLSKLATK